MSSLEFSAILDQINFHGKFIGFKIASKSEKTSKIDKFLQYFTCIAMLSFCGVFLVHGIYERYYGTHDMFADIVCYSISQIGLVGCYSNFHLFLRQNDLRELMFWCDSLYKPKPNGKMQQLWIKIFEQSHRRSVLLARGFFYFILLDDGMLFLGAIVSKIFLKEGLLMLTMYRMDGFVQEMPWYWLLCCYQLVVLIGYLLQYTYNMAIFGVFTQHVNGQLEYIGAVLENLDQVTENSKELGKILDHVVELHVDVLGKIKRFSKIFSFPMLLSEIAPLACFVLIGLTIFVKQSDYHQAASTTLLLLSAAIYAHFGESIIQHSKDVSLAAYSYNWYELSVENQKKMKFIIMMSQRATGVTSGGFHNVCYLQYSRIMARGYNIMLGIVNFFKNV